MRRRIARVGVREGYDLWAASYERTQNPLVALDRLHTPKLLRPRQRERILDAGCGTGFYVRTMRRQGARPVGVDFSRAMLHAARRANPGVRLVQADLDRRLPIARRAFDAMLCALVSEHLPKIGTLFREAFAVLRDGGRLIFSAFHPELAAAGVEANFERGGTEYRLGAERHTVEDYLGMIEDAGFTSIHSTEHAVDAAVVQRIPWATKYLGRPILLLIEARR